MHGNVNDPTEEGKDSFGLLHSFFEFDVFVPEDVRKEVKAYGGGATLEESALRCQFDSW